MTSDPASPASSQRSNAVDDEQDSMEDQVATHRNQEDSLGLPRGRRVRRNTSQSQTTAANRDAENLARFAQSNLRLRTRPFFHSPKPFCFRTSFKSFSNMAEIAVGSNATPFVVHQALLTQHSPFFAAALDGAFREGLEKTVHLPDVDSKYFEHIVLWMYTETLEDRTFFFKDGKPTYFTLLDLYALADRLDIEGMRNALCDHIAVLAEETNSVPTPSDTYILYETIRDNAPVRSLVLDLFAFKKTDNLIATHPDDWHATFLRDLVCKLKRPGFATLKRHDIRTWKAPGWQFTKACEVCKRVLKPGAQEHQCVRCKRAFCESCVAKGVGGGGLDWNVIERDCKPWLAAMCASYHEHSVTDICGLSFEVQHDGGRTVRIATR